MYYLIMKTAVRSDLKSKTFCSHKSFIIMRDNRNILVDSKFYQKLFVVLISLSTLLIFPESPRDLERICENYNSRKLCNVW